MLGNTSLLLTPISLGCESNEQLASQSDKDQLVFVLDFQDYKSENAQLEELLFAERELSKSYEARIKQLQQDLSVSKNDVMRVESNMAEALAIKNSKIEALVSATDGLKKEAAISEGNMASLQALREEQASAE
ncbi:hypothetical protein FNV43_RR19739 [Rhamnella rubrinervis]|uniref:Uncharacterized protein n=1 Tax=Rhamnella rubrinervis TaxID=2594499 RepID=A0A8K0DUM6_9ROSA|nr:hypothetical protein FNV43_RR19739 [Rhamnella rubrinervis]